VLLAKLLKVGRSVYLLPWLHRSISLIVEMCGSTRRNYLPEEMSCFIIRSSVDAALGGELVGGHVGNVNASLENSQGLLSSVLVQRGSCTSVRASW